MKKVYILTILIGLYVSVNKLQAQAIWTGPKITFTKVDLANHTMEVNQDRITDNVWITRANNQGIFNVATETVYTVTSPSDTEWAFGTTANIGSLTFDNWKNAVASNPPAMVNQDMVLHLITDDIYIDLKFTSWTSLNTGGGFSYERSTDESLDVNEFEFNERLKIYPNPSSNVIKVSGLTKTENYKIFNMLGAEICAGIIDENKEMNVQNFNRGIYFVQFNNGESLKFIKK